jgi:hypothetical protein
MMVKSSEKKYDVGKAPMFRGLLNRFPRALRTVAEISAFGFRKYGTFDGWEKVEDAEERYEDALLRHLTAAAAGDLVDSESKRLHLAHAAWNALAILELALRRLGPK